VTPIGVCDAPEARHHDEDVEEFVVRS
jgi:hypothetical protein